MGVVDEMGYLNDTLVSMGSRIHTVLPRTFGKCSEKLILINIKEVICLSLITKANRKATMNAEYIVESDACKECCIDFRATHPR